MKILNEIRKWILTIAIFISVFSFSYVGVTSEILASTNGGSIAYCTGESCPGGCACLGECQCWPTGTCSCSCMYFGGGGTIWYGSCSGID
jgi:hypothetical protein